MVGVAAFVSHTVSQSLSLSSQVNQVKSKSKQSEALAFLLVRLVASMRLTARTR